MNIIFTIIIIIVFLTLLIYLDFQLGEKFQAKKVKRKNHPFRYTDFHIYRDGTELFPDLFESMKVAKSHIHILFYTVKTDSISNEFLSVLQEKSKQGVEVRLLLDWLGSIKIRKKIRQKLTDAGVQFAFCHIPKLPFLFYSLQVRNHRKIAIIDGKVGYMGGFNVGKDYVHMNFKLSPWRDYHLKMIGEGVDDLQREFLVDWLEASKINLLQNKVYFPEQTQGKSRHQLIATQGVYLEEIIADLIRNAKTSITIGTPYFIPTKTIMEELLFALKRNVTITLLLPNSSDHILVKEASFPYLRVLLKQNARVFQYLNGFFHGKLIIADDSICMIGSSNFDRRSIFLNFELNCCIYDPDFIADIQKVVKQDLQQSEELYLNNLKTLNIWRIMKEWIARLFASFL